MTRRLSVLILAGLLVAAVPRDPEVQLTPDWMLEGTWRTIYLEDDNGNPHPPGDGYAIEIKGEELVWSRDDVPFSKARLRLDASTDPAHLDAHYANTDKVYPGICKREGDRLIVCVSMDLSLPRPKDFHRAKHNQPVYVFRQKR